jgi:hypothetical protein
METEMERNYSTSMRPSTHSSRKKRGIRLLGVTNTNDSDAERSRSVRVEGCHFFEKTKPTSLNSHRDDEYQYPEKQTRSLDRSGMTNIIE